MTPPPIRANLLALATIGLCAAGGPACGDAPPPKTPPQLDVETFRDEVEPILAERCGNPTTCHAADHRPFTLYVRRARRMEPDDVYRDPPLTASEHRANYDRTRSFALHGEESELLRKPLAPDAGGTSHEGDVDFHSRRAPDYQTLVDWVTGGGT